MQNTEKLKEILKNYPKPVKLQIKIVALKGRYSTTGDQKRYFKTYIDNLDITEQIAELIEEKLSVTKQFGKCIILHGCGEDKAWRLQYTVSIKAEKAGLTGMFDRQHYTLIP